MEGKWPYPSWLRRSFLSNVYTAVGMQKKNSNQTGMELTMLEAKKIFKFVGYGIDSARRS
jgi:hypothetical protein